MSRGNGTNSYYGYTDASGGQTPYLTAMTHDLAGSGYDLSTAYSYNQAGQIIGKASSNAAYDGSTGVSVTRSYTTNALNQYTASGGVALGYDARGNLTSSGSSGYVYTGRNLMSSALGNGLYYDALGRLDLDFKAGQDLLYAGTQLLLVRNDNGGATVERHVYGRDEAPIASYDAGATRRWLYTDERGSVIALADDAGNAQNINKYDAFGIPASGNAGRFQYTGQQWLPSAGLSYYKARMYSPTLGRFMQTDPIGYADGINWYNYTGGDPVNATDPSGLATACILHENSLLANGYVDDGSAHGGAGLRTIGTIFCYTVPDESHDSYQSPGSGSPDIIMKHQKPQKDEQKSTPAKDKYACLKAVALGGVGAALDPVSLIGGAVGGTVMSYGSVARAAFPLGRALNIARAATPGFLAVTAATGVAGAVKSYFTDEACK